MIGVNLIPAGVLRARRRRRRIRHWTVAALVAAAISAVPVLLQVRQHARQARLVERREATSAELANVRASVETVGTSLRRLGEGIERADTLRTRRSWAGLLARVVQCMPDEVWLTSLATETPQDSARASRGKVAPQQAAPASSTPGAETSSVAILAGARRLALQGFAVNHEQLYEFMTRLKGSRSFSGVELVKAGKEPVLRSRGVRFELTCTW
ncbi:MAG TPA: PilN domain-containing protein [Phycisphaerae bacterium]|nr:PilN domain-containing protein [Phycisphaerae bacterium]